MAEKKTSTAQDGKATRRALDFTNVKDRGPYNPKHKSEGDYRARITAVEERTSGQGNLMWVYAVKLVSDESAVYPLRCVLNEANLWKLRNLLQACGFTIPKKKVNVDPNKPVGKEIGITLEDDEYEGKMKSVIQATFKASELTEDEPEGDDEESDDAEEETDDDEDLEEIEVDEL